MDDVYLEKKEGVQRDADHQEYASSPDRELGVRGKRKFTPNGVELVPQPSDDPRDPLNWSMSKRIAIFFIMCFGTFCATATAVANVLATTVQSKTWGVTPDQAAYSVSAVLAGIIVGPVLLVPLVRVFGVMSCCFWSLIAVMATSIWSAESDGPDDYGSFVASRAIAGLFAGTCYVFSPGVISQIFFLHQRGRALAVYSTVYMVATVAGPSFSGFVVQYVNWPIAFWWTVAANGFAALLFFILGDDTAWDRVNQKPITDKPMPTSWLGKRAALFFPGTRTVPTGGKARNIAHSFSATFRVGFSPISVLSGLYSLISFAWFIMAGVQVPILLQDPVSEGGYGFDAQSTAFFYFSAWIGAIAGVGYGILLNDRIPLWLQRRNGGVWHPEYRLQTAWIPGLVLGPIGCGLFGAAAYYHTHWIVLAVGECFIVFGATASVPPTVNYVIEVFKSHAQEVSTSLNVWRIGFSVAIQFFYASWVDAVGVNWVWGTAAFIYLFGFALVLVMMWNGPQLRAWSLLPDEAALENSDGSDPKEASDGS